MDNDKKTIHNSSLTTTELQQQEKLNKAAELLKNFRENENNAEDALKLIQEVIKSRFA